MFRREINIRTLKEFAFNRLPKDWVLREILLSERDILDVYEFVAKVDLWLKLARKSDFYELSRFCG